MMFFNICSLCFPTYFQFKCIYLVNYTPSFFLCCPAMCEVSIGYPYFFLCSCFCQLPHASWGPEPLASGTRCVYVIFIGHFHASSSIGHRLSSSSSPLSYPFASWLLPSVCVSSRELSVRWVLGQHGELCSAKVLPKQKPIIARPPETPTISPILLLSLSLTQLTVLKSLHLATCVCFLGRVCVLSWMLHLRLLLTHTNAICN